MRSKTAPKSANQNDGRHEDDAIDPLRALEARSQIIGLSVNMGWRMAIAVIVPVIIGVKLDQKFDTSPSLTITALFLAIAASAMIVSRTVKELSDVQKMQDQQEAKSAKPPKDANDLKPVEPKNV